MRREALGTMALRPAVLSGWAKKARHARPGLQFLLFLFPLVDLHDALELFFCCNVFR